MADALKHVYTRTYLKQVAAALVTADVAFPTQRFLRSVFDKQWPQRELKDRMYHITDVIMQCFDQNYKRAVKAMKQAAPHFGSYEAMFFPAIVEVYGINDWRTSLPAMALFTQYSSSEYAVRPFIIQDQDRMMKQMLQWSSHRNHHIRRLASEGCRPRLPWAPALPALKQDPQPILPILEALKQDASEYVRRSVANNLNDISKDHPDLVLQIAKSWLGQNADTNSIVKHACRSLLKAGNKQAMLLFGYADPSAVSISNLSIKPKRIKIGDKASFDFTLSCKADAAIRIEYAIDYLKKNGTHNRKVFKISETDNSESQRLITRRHDFQQRSTRIHYPGKHHLHIIINGVVKASIDFTLLA